MMNENRKTDKNMAENKKNKNHTAFDISGRIYSYISMAMIICVFSFILIIVFRYGWSSLSLEFLTTVPNPSAINTDSGGILTPIIGTFILTIIGIIIAFPFALATAVYLCFYTKKGVFRAMVKSAVDILAGVPTVVVALFALAIFTLPQMGFLSVQVDTRSNALSRTEFVFIYAEETYRNKGLEDWDENILSGLENFNESEGYWNAFGEWVEGINPDAAENNGEIKEIQRQVADIHTNMLKYGLI